MMQDAMNVLMFTNTFAPHVGGVRRSIDMLSAGLRARDHQVLTVAPTYTGHEINTHDVIRVPALKHVYGTDFSLPLPFGRNLRDRIDAFQPDVIHSHHPFLLGATALRIAAMYDVPIVYTYHTRYEFYGRAILTQSSALRLGLRSLSFGYCNLCDAVVAPSKSIADILRAGGVSVPIRVVATGTDIAAFKAGRGHRFRRKANIPLQAFLVGHVGRLSEEKNLHYLTDALIDFLSKNPGAHAVIAGGGPLDAALKQRFEAARLSGRVHFAGVVSGVDLTDLYAAMDIFAFASISETQGLVLQEAMASGRPVLALDAPGARDLVDDDVNGRLLPATATSFAFSDALSAFARLPDQEKNQMQKAAMETAQAFTVENMINGLLGLYRDVCANHSEGDVQAGSEWDRALRGLAEEGLILSNIFHALGDAVVANEDHYAHQ